MYKKVSYNGKKVLIMGLGLHGGGVGVAKWFAKHKADILITDMKTKSELKESIAQLKKYPQIKYRLGKHIVSDFKDTDIVIANPIVRQDNKFLKVARANDAMIYNDVSLFVDLCPCQIVGITGTKGKSTTTALTYQLLKGCNKKVYLGGNIRISPFSFLDKLNANDIVVLEISSWQAEGLEIIKKSPHISLLTNLGIDHLNTYKSYNAYIKAKGLIFKYQHKNDIAILNKQDKDTKVLLKNIPAKKVYFNINAKVGIFFKDKYLYYKNKKLLSETDLPLIGKHNKENILAALTICSLYNISTAKIRQSLQSFKTLSGRMQTVRNLDGVLYINDTTATAPLATEASLMSLDKPIVLIAGGNDKELGIKGFADIIMQRAIFAIMLPGTATEKVVEIFIKNKFQDFRTVKTMKEAVQFARKKALRGDIIILSPGATSFGSFINEFDRGDKYIKEVKLLRNG
jgi:UDP-N-acetylmuramoylalanine--D-glutamate ligase